MLAVHVSGHSYELQSNADRFFLHSDNAAQQHWEGFSIRSFSLALKIFTDWIAEVRNA